MNSLIKHIKNQEKFLTLLKAGACWQVDNDKSNDIIFLESLNGMAYIK